VRPQITKEAFLDFCSKKPPNESYDFCQAHYCAIAQFLKSMGVQNYVLTSDEIPISIRKEVNCLPWTFGALTMRLRGGTRYVEFFPYEGYAGEPI